MASEQIEIDYRFRLTKAGSTDFGSTNIDLEVSTTQDPISFTRVDRWGGQRVQPLEARAESSPWQVNIAEKSTGEQVTGSLSSTKLLGPDAMRRLADFAVREGGSTGSYQVEAGGRLTDLDLSQDVADYRFTVQDDVFVARTAGAFNKNDTRIFPKGVDEEWGTGRFQAAQPLRRLFEVQAVSGTGNAQVAIVEGVAIPILITHDELDEIADDVVADPRPASDNFENLRMRTTDGDDITPVAISGSPVTEPTKKLERKAELSDEVRFDAGQLTLHTTRYSDGDRFKGFIHAFGRDPSTVLPLHQTTTPPLEF